MNGQVGASFLITSNRFAMVSVLVDVSGEPSPEEQLKALLEETK